MNNADLKSYNSKRKIVQLGFVTNDYKKTIAYLYERLLIGPWVIMEHKSGVTKVKELHGKPVNEPFRFYCASAMLGDMEFEVIQPDYGPNPYSEFLETRGPGIHHIKEKIDDDIFKERCDTLLSKGTKVAFNGEFFEDLFVYLDTMDEIGSMYELGNCPLIEDNPVIIGNYPEK